MSRGAESEVFLTVPVFQVMLSLEAGTGKIRYLIVRKAVCAEFFTHCKVHIRSFILVGKPERISFLIVRSALLKLEHICADMRRTCSDAKIQRFVQGIKRLILHAEHHVKRNIIYPCGKALAYSFFNQSAIRKPSELFSLIFNNRLYAQRNSVHSRIGDGFKKIFLNRRGITLNGYLPVNTEKSFRPAYKHRNIPSAEQRRRTTAEVKRVGFSAEFFRPMFHALNQGNHIYIPVGVVTPH